MNIFDPLITGSLSVSGSGEISGDLTVLGTINATISGTTSNAISASEAPRYTLTSSFGAFTSSYTTGSFTGAFIGDGTDLYNIPASGVTGLNLTRISDGSVTASISNIDGLRVNTNTEITGALVITGSISLNGVPVGTGKLDETTFNDYTSSIDDYIDDTQALIDTLATTGSNLFKGTQTHSGSIIPSVDNTYDLGSPDYQWRDVYISSGSLYIDGSKVLSSTAQELTITTDEGQSIKILEGTTDSIVLQVADGDIELKSSADGDILLDPTNGKIMLKGPVEIFNGNKIQSSVNGTPVVFANDIVVSGSIELTGTIDGIDLSSLSSSLNTRIGSIESTTLLLNEFTSSANGRLNSLESETSSLSSSIGSVSSSITNTTNNLSSSIGVFSSSFTSTITNLSSSMITLSSSFTDTDISHNNRLNTIESRYTTTGSNVFIGNQTITGSLYISQNLIVQGESSLENVTASAVSIGTNTVILNADTPSVRYAGIAVYDSGSTNVTASLLYDSLTNQWKFKHLDTGTNDASVLLYGPLGNDIDNTPTLTSNFLTKVEDNDHGHHLTTSSVFDNGSKISLKNNTEVTGSLIITGTLVSQGTTLISGSSQVSFNTISDKPSGIISGSSQVVSSLPNGTVSGSSQVSFNTISDKPTLVSGSSQVSFSTISDKPTLVSGSSQITFGLISSIPGGLVSGSSQIDLTATTNYSSGIKTRLNAEGVVSGSSQVTGIGNAQLTNSSFHVGTTSISLGRASASQTLTGVSIDGNAATATSATDSTKLPLTGGTITGPLTINTTGDIIANGDTFRMKGGGGSAEFIWYRNYSGEPSQPGFVINNRAGATTFSHNANGGGTSVSGNFSAANFSGSSSGTNTGDQTNISGNAATATTATTATKLSGGGSAGDAYIILYDNNSGDLNTYNSPGIYSSEYIGSTNRPGSQNGHWIQISDNGGTDVKSQWYYDSDGANLYTRVMWGNGTWRSWKTMIHSGNIGSQSVSSATTSTNSTNLSGLGIIQSTSTGTSYQYNYQVRENSGGGGNTSETYAPQLAFHWSGVVASSIMMEASGRIAIRNNPGGAYENFIASTIYASSSFQGNLTGNVTGNVTGTANNITAYTINQNLGTSNSPTFATVNASNLTATCTTDACGLSLRSSSEVLSGEGWATALYCYNNNDGFLVLGRDASANARPVFHIGGFNNAGHGGWSDGDAMVTLVRMDGVKTTGSGNSYRGLSNSSYYSNIVKTTSRTEFKDSQGTHYFNGNVTIAGTLTETSSTRYKTNIKTIESGLDKVLQMRGVVYNRKDNGKEEIGVIAEEMNEILPQVIQYNTESEIDSVSYSRIVGVLIEAIKELKQEVNELKNNG